MYGDQTETPSPLPSTYLGGVSSMQIGYWLVQIKESNYAKVGIVFLGMGFVFQLVGTWMK